ncbi:MAG: hypothetical protein V2A73_14815 [Pseudomonadota bacterium]
MKQREHNVTVRIGEKLVERWSAYSIDSDMLSPADGFSVTLPGPTSDLYQLCVPDAAVQVFVDDVPLVTGYIDDRELECSKQGRTLTIAGRDKGGRLVDESCPLKSFIGMSLEQLARFAVTPWFEAVAFSNARNRSLLRGRFAHKAKVAGEPIFNDIRHAPRKVMPGQSRWDVLKQFLEEANVLAWSSADGEEFVIGQPNYTQSPQYKFFLPSTQSTRAAEGNVIRYSLRHSVAERYSSVVTMGAARGDDWNYGAAVTKRRAVVNNGTGADGIGVDFQHRKVLYVSDDEIKTIEHAQARASREAALRDSTGERLDLVVRGHVQCQDQNHWSLYAIDNMAFVEIEELDLSGLYLIVTVQFTVSVSEGEITKLTLVPKDTLLRI